MSIKSKCLFEIFFIVIFILGIERASYGKQTLTALKTQMPPVIDGKIDTGVWDKAKEMITHDKIADIDIAIKALYDKQKIYFLVRFPDPDESRSHKPWVWDKEMGIYGVGPDREDVFQFVFSMENTPVDLSIFADNDYIADCWFWKADRSDPSGFADDKINRLSDSFIESAVKLQSKTGKIMYLSRDLDKGTHMFKSQVLGDYQGDKLPRFIHRFPFGSCADISAKGVWQNGFWTLEFSRALDTGYPDDARFDTDKEYIFGVSRYEIAGRDTEPSLTQPLYGKGDVSEELILSFER